MKQQKAIDCIEYAKSYYLLSNDKTSKPVLIGNRIQLEFALSNVDKDMIIATSGNKAKCVILVDFTTEDVLILQHIATNKVLKIKQSN